MKTNRKIGIALTVILLTILSVLIFQYAVPVRNKVYQTEFPAMGTVAKISVYSSNADLTAAFELCSREFDLVSRTCSLYDPDSELSRLNATAASAPFECSDMMWELLIRAEKAHRESDGYFDITVKPLMDLWGFYRKREQPPSEREIAETMKVIGFDKLILDKQKKTVLFSVPGMALDLGGIAKGYAVDRAYDAINAAGIRAGVIDIGGNLRMLPEPPPGKKFYLVSIRDPHHRESVLPDQLKVAPGKAVSTSGDYERFVVFNNRRYSHIISPKTGSPTTASAVSVIAGTAVDADIYSTSCSLGGEAVAAGIKQEKPETEIIFTR